MGPVIVIDQEVFAVTPWTVSKKPTLRRDLLAETETIFALSNGHWAFGATSTREGRRGPWQTYLAGFFETEAMPHHEAGGDEASQGESGGFPTHFLADTDRPVIWERTVTFSEYQRAVITTGHRRRGRAAGSAHSGSSWERGTESIRRRRIPQRFDRNPGIFNDREAWLIVDPLGLPAVVYMLSRERCVLGPPYH